MVCIQCYLPPILFMIYMKLVHPIIGPYVQPLFNKVVSYFWGQEALNNDACPIRPNRAKKNDTGGDSATKPKDE